MLTWLRVRDGPNCIFRLWEGLIFLSLKTKTFIFFSSYVLPVGVMFPVSVYPCSSTTLWADRMTFDNVCPSSWAAVLKRSHTYTRSLTRHLFWLTAFLQTGTVWYWSHNLLGSHKHGSDSNSSRANSTLTTFLWLNICWTSVIATSHGWSISLLHLFFESDLYLHIWKTLLSNVTYIAIKVHNVWSFHAFPGNQTHYFVIAGVILWLMQIYLKNSLWSFQKS